MMQALLDFAIWLMWLNIYLCITLVIQTGMLLSVTYMIHFIMLLFGFNTKTWEWHENRNSKNN